MLSQRRQRAHPVLGLGYHKVTEKNITALRPSNNLETAGATCVPMPFLRLVGQSRRRGRACGCEGAPSLTGSPLPPADAPTFRFREHPPPPSRRLLSPDDFSWAFLRSSPHSRTLRRLSELVRRSSRPSSGQPLPLYIHSGSRPTRHKVIRHMPTRHR